MTKFYQETAKRLWQH